MGPVSFSIGVILGALLVCAIVWFIYKPWTEQECKVKVDSASKTPANGGTDAIARLAACEEKIRLRDQLSPSTTPLSTATVPPPSLVVQPNNPAPPSSTPTPIAQVAPAPLWVSLTGYGFIGNDMAGSPFSDMTQDTCRDKCKTTTGCVAAQYSPSSRSCWLKSDMGAANINADSVVLIPTATGGVASWTKSIGFDHAGDDIACYTDGTTVDKCASLCALHKNCKAYNAVNSSAGGGWAKGGCCLKTVNAPTGPVPPIDFYTGNR